MCLMEFCTRISQKQYLQNNNWSDALSSYDPQDAFQMFSDCYRDAYGKYFPLRTIEYG